MALKLSQLSFFCALVEEGTIQAAAKKMHCVPSNMTNRIKSLEESLNTALFNREQHRLVLTSEGRVFYEEAKLLLANTEKIQNLFSHQQLAGYLKIGVLNFVLEKYLYNSINPFLLENQKARIDLVVLSSLPLMKRLINNQLDLIFVDGEIKHPLLHSQVIRKEQLFLVTKAASFAEFKRKSTSKILYSFGKTCLHHELFTQWLTQNNISYDKHCAIESYSWALTAVDDDVGFTVVPQPYIADAEKLGLSCYPLHDIGNCDVSMVWLKSNQSPLLAALINSFKVS